METIQTRALKAAARFLERRGYEILDTEFFEESEPLDIVAEYDGTYVFVGVTAARGSEPFRELLESQREEAEGAAARWLGENAEVDRPVRFDAVAMRVVSEDRAFLRHHINCLASL